VSNFPVSRWIFFVSAVLTLIAFLQRDRLPPSEEVLSDLLREPVQSDTLMEPFVRTRGGVAYTITPVADYEISGLVVSYRNVGTWMDYYKERWRDELNIKDVGLVWGENIKKGGYRRAAWTNTAWVLNWNAKSREDHNNIIYEKLSNNHLLSDDDELSRLILKVRPGDQVYIKGYLAQYAHDLGGPFFRGTSVTRTDVGNGACETIFVKQFKILKGGNPGWRSLFWKSLFVMLASLSIIVLMFMRQGMTPARFE